MEMESAKEHELTDTFFSKIVTNVNNSVNAIHSEKWI